MDYLKPAYLVSLTMSVWSPRFAAEKAISRCAVEMSFLKVEGTTAPKETCIPTNHMKVVFAKLSSRCLNSILLHPFLLLILLQRSSWSFPKTLAIFANCFPVDFMIALHFLFLLRSSTFSSLILPTIPARGLLSAFEDVVCISPTFVALLFATKEEIKESFYSDLLYDIK